MAHEAESPGVTMRLPTLVFGVVEVRRLQWELSSLEEYLRQAAIRDKATKTASSLPRISRLLDALASENHCNLLKPQERAVLAAFLKTVQKAPTIHMSFASDPSSAVTAKIVAWLRTNIHPWVLLQIGLQPSLAAGCVVRTPNKVFDLSLRQHFDTQKTQFIELLRTSVTAAAPAASTNASVTAPAPQPEQNVKPASPAPARTGAVS